MPMETIMIRKNDPLPETLPRMSFEEFLRSDGEQAHVEWVNGEVVQMAPVGNLHQDLKGFLLSIVRTHVSYYKLGVVRDDPFQMKAGPGLPSRAPDILFIAKKRLSRLRENFYDGPADLVIEIISPASRVVDRGEKFYEYEQAGVREYWLLDPQRKQAEFYRLGRDGIFHPVPPDANGIFTSAAIKGLWIGLSWLWQQPLPSEIEVFKAWDLVK